MPKTLSFDSPPVAQGDSYSVNQNETLDQVFLGNHLRFSHSVVPNWWGGVLNVYSTDVDMSSPAARSQQRK